MYLCRGVCECVRTCVSASVFVEVLVCVCLPRLGCTRTSLRSQARSALQEAGRISLSDLAVQYALNTELLASMLQTRLGGAIQVRHGHLGCCRLAFTRMKA